MMGDERLIAAERTVRESARVDDRAPDWFNQNFDEGFFQPAVLATRCLLNKRASGRRFSAGTRTPSWPREAGRCVPRSRWSYDTRNSRY